MFSFGTLKSNITLPIWSQGVAPGQGFCPFIEKEQQSQLRVTGKCI